MYDGCSLLTKITKEIALYMGNNFKKGGDIKRTLDKLTVANIPPPTDLSIATAAATADPNANIPRQC